MRIEILTCHSIIAQCLENLDYFNLDSTGNILLDELYRRKLVIHQDLEEEYINYFTNVRPDLLDLFMTFFSSIVTQQDNVKIISLYKKTSFTSNEYFNVLLGVCMETHDKILLSNLSTPEFEHTIKNQSICKLSAEKVVDRNDDNLLNSYRLPIIRKVINPDQSSTDLSKWITRFIIDQNDFLIIDNYLYENRDQFLNYFLKNVNLNANIEIYTMVNNGNSESNLIATFKNSPFNKWNFNIHIITRKKDQHARDIFTDKYYIEIDKGMMVFGHNDKTHQANINIAYKKEIHDITLPQSRVAVG